MSKQIVGVDIGYGFTKSTDGEQIVIFPSVAGDVCEADFDNDLVKAGRGRVLEIDPLAFEGLDGLLSKPIQYAVRGLLTPRIPWDQKGFAKVEPNV